VRLTLFSPRPLRSLTDVELDAVTLTQILKPLAIHGAPVENTLRPYGGYARLYPLSRQMYHVVNHSSYNRGQLTMMLRQLAARPVPTDFLVFQDELERR
jgi:hypothetical protein